ncbi:MAG: DUF3014 domain-containing protein [Zoogloeaceae bacterium]|nr:DUF3014 domain-containing protein [Rhodocyclaceae bacterium]MCP5235933.1 DUF3014 domain-containing protein [Zoogloeaceae bacterium]
MKLVLGILAVVGALALAWFMTRPPTLVVPPPASPVVEAPTAPAADGSSADGGGQPAFPIDRLVLSGGEVDTDASRPAAGAPAQVAGEPVPSLADSGPAVESWLGWAIGSGGRGLLAGSDVVRRVVATVDNLSREKASVRLWPVSTAAGLPVVDSRSGGPLLMPANSARYAAFVELAESVDVDALISGYKALYPVFQEAYRELGYPTGNFNDRLVGAIDHLLASPEIEGPIALVQPKVIYQFADPELESLSAGQKIMVRIGPDNARRIKQRLRVIRRRLAGQR